MKHEAIIAARNLLRILPVTVIAFAFTYITTKAIFWSNIVGVFFIVFWVLSTIADLSYRKALIKMREGKHNDK